MNWRGQFARGTDIQGRVIDCPEGGTPTPSCIRLAWPGHRTTAWHLEAKAPDVVTWYGGLVDGMRDASGQMYMRNRYYDPSTGQFTQPDPIGLAGGLNAYGFAAGDPVSYADPYGLCPESMRIAGDKCPGGLSDEQWNSVHEGAETLDDGERIAIIEKLAGGEISAEEIGPGKYAHTNWAWDGTSAYVLNTLAGVSFFE